MKNNERNFEKDNQEDSTNLAAEIRLINKITKAEKRIESGESYIEMSEIKRKLGIKK